MAFLGNAFFIQPDSLIAGLAHRKMVQRHSYLSVWLSDCWGVDLKGWEFLWGKGRPQRELVSLKEISRSSNKVQDETKNQMTRQSRTFSRTAWLSVFLSPSLNFDLHDLKDGLRHLWDLFVLLSPISQWDLNEINAFPLSTFVSFNWRLVERWPDLTGHKLSPPSRLLESSLGHNKNKTKTLVP